MARIDKPNLSSLRVGISVSESADLQRLGLSEGHLRLSLGEIARTILIHGGTLCYGGHLDPNGYTAFLVHELERYGDPARPLCICLPWSEHAGLSSAFLKQRSSEYGLYATVVYLDINGQEMSREDNECLTLSLTKGDRVRALTGMRQYMSRNCHSRILLGGKLVDFQGALPGLVEEALLALQHKTPLLVAGGFGGAALEILRAINDQLAEWLPPSPIGWTPTSEISNALVTIGTSWAKNVAESENFNLLDGEAMRQLAATHRPSEIATIVGRALISLSKQEDKA